MTDPNYDPYEELQNTTFQTLKNSSRIEILEDKLQQSCELAEAMSLQLKHLTNAIIGLQQVNKILNQRVTLLENLLK
jgi:hypothetical protein